MSMLKRRSNLPIKILIVDDSITQAEKLRFYLEDENYECFVAYNGLDALILMKQHQPHLVISDVVMPQMDGYEFCHQAKTDLALKHIPIMLLTSLSDTLDIIRGLESGADNFITKPYDIDYLLTRIDYILTNRALLREEKMQMGVEISFGGSRHFITSERQQILDLLISTYEQAVHINGKLKVREQELEASNLYLFALNSTGNIVSQSLDLNQILNDALQKLIEIVEIDAAGIFLIENDEPILTTEHHLPVELRQFMNWQTANPQLKDLLLRANLPLIITIGDTEEQESELAQLDLSSIKGLSIYQLICVPLTAKHEMVGVIVLATYNAHNFKQTDIELMQGIGNQIAVAVENARLYQLTKSQRIHEQAALLNLSHYLLTTFNIDDVLAKTIEVTASLIKAESLAIFLPDEQFETLVMRYCLEGKRVSNHALSFPIASTLIISEIFNGSSNFFSWAKSQSEQTDLPAEIQVGFYNYGYIEPITLNNEVLGILLIKTNESIDDDGRRLLSLFANQCAMGLNSVYSYQEEQRHALKLEKMSLLVTEVTAQQDEDNLLIRAVNGITELLSTRETGFYEFDSNQQVLTLRAFNSSLRDNSAINDRLDRDMAMQLANSSEAIILKDYLSDHHSQDLVKKRAKRYTLIAVPVRHQSNKVGLLYVIGREKSERFALNDVQLLTLFGRQLGVCLENLQAAQALRKSEERFQLVVRATNDALWDWNLITNEIWCDETFVHLVGFGLKAQTLTVGHWQEHIEVEDRTRVIESINEILNSNREIWFNEYRIRNIHGGISVVTDRAYVVRDEQGRPVRMIGSVIDITERKISEEKIQEQAALLNITADAVIVCDLQDRILFWNHGAEHIYGWSEPEANGQSATALLNKDFKPEQLAEIRAKVMSQDHWSGELKQVTKAGESLIIESRWTLMRNEKRVPKSILLVNTDISERKKLEVQFLRTQRLENLGVLAGGIAHDLNNVLTPLMLASQILKNRIQDERSLQILNTFEMTTRRGAELIQQILSFARGIEGERRVFQVQHLFAEIEKLVRETFPRAISITTNFPHDLWVLSGDNTQLNQVLMNLCVNARDAMPDGGTLTLEAKNVHIDENYAGMDINAKVGPYVVITVTDSGSGIPQHIINSIFDPFFTTKPIGKGTGLGLSTVHTIIKNHGGFIKVYSEEDKGTKFSIFLPAAHIEGLEQKDFKPVELPKGNNETILVVDDEAAIREITKTTLEAYGYNVLVASDGSEVLALFVENSNKIEVVITDMMMPFMDGITTIRALRRVDDKIKVIAVTGLTSTDKATEMQSLAVKAILSKPYTAETLLTTIDRVLKTE